MAVQRRAAAPVAARLLVRLAAALAALGAVGVLLARVAPRDWPSSAAGVPGWVAAGPADARIVSLATVAAWGCLGWLAFVLVAVTVGAFPRGAVRDAAERVLGIAVVGVATGALVAGPAAADGPFDRPAGPATAPPGAAAATAAPATPPNPAPGASPPGTASRESPATPMPPLGPGATPPAVPPPATPSPPGAPAPPEPMPVAGEPGPPASPATAGPDGRPAARAPGGVPGTPGPPAAPSPAAARADPDGEVVVVERGNTLWDIAARRLGAAATPALTAATWPRWYAANRHLIGADPDLIHPGQRLVPPSDGGLR